MADAKKDKLQIRNSTVDFLVFTKDAHEDGIEVRVQDHDVWLTQKAIAQLFDVDRSVVTKHLKNVYESGELSEDTTCANFAQVADNGKTYHYKFYSLSAIIAVGYRINSGRATQFRQWATKVLDTFTKQGYVLDKSRLINGQIFDEDYFDHLMSFSQLYYYFFFDKAVYRTEYHLQMIPPELSDLRCQRLAALLCCHARNHKA